MRKPPVGQPSIPARHSRAGETLIYWTLMRSAIWSHFARVWLRVEGPIPTPADGPLIFYLNHPSWWDGYMAYVLNRMVLGNRFQGFCMMDEHELRRYRFFTWLGAFSMNRQDARSALGSVAYIGRLLATRRDRAVLTHEGVDQSARRPSGEGPGHRRAVEVGVGQRRQVGRVRPRLGAAEEGRPQPGPGGAGGERGRHVRAVHQAAGPDQGKLGLGPHPGEQVEHRHRRPGALVVGEAAAVCSRLGALDPEPVGTHPNSLAGLLDGGHRDEDR